MSRTQSFRGSREEADTKQTKTETTTQGSETREESRVLGVKTQLSGGQIRRCLQMFVHVEVRDLSVHLQCWSGEWCVCPPRQMLDRGVTERVTVFLICVNAAHFQVCTPGFLLVVRLPLLAASQKGSSLPRLVGVQHYTQTHTYAHTAWSSSVLQPCPAAESQITVRPLSRCSAVFLKTREEKREE